MNLQGRLIGGRYEILEKIGDRTEWQQYIKQNVMF